MKISFLAAFTLIGTALAVPAADGKQKTIPVNGPCTKDGKMGICENGGFCLQDKNASQGKCKPKN